MKIHTSIWPHDVFKDLIPSVRENPNHLCCFLICPFSPKESADEIFNVVQSACNVVGKQLGCQVECRRADKIVSSGVIHSEIWHEIQTADVIIADITGLNGNVMLELGVAAAIRRKEHVIILKEENPEEDFLFDIDPARHLIYKRHLFSEYQEILQKLTSAILMSLTSAPFEIEPNILDEKPKILEANFNNGKDVEWLIGPSITHRRLTPEYLEFGSLFIFRNSWLRIGNFEFKNFKLNSQMKFTKTRDVGCWIGISIRNHHFFANYGHLLYINSEGLVIRTVPENELAKYHDEKIAEYPNFDINKVFEFNIEINKNYFSMYIDNIGNRYKVAEMPYVYPSGNILFQTYNARAGILSIKIESLD
ncbi:hypothetical protein ACFLQS_00760 [Actinomycetota bacterium]